MRSIHSFNHLAAVTQERISLELLSNNTEALLPPEIFDSNSRFDFYRIRLVSYTALLPVINHFGS